MSELKLSNNGLFLASESKIFFALENKSYDLNEIKLSQWIDIIFENSLFSLKNKLVEGLDVTVFHRKLIYQLLSELSFNKKSKLIFEYENKFGNNLLTENVELNENWLTNAWKWTKDTVTSTFSEFGSAAVKSGQDLFKCINGQGCNPFFQDFRTMLMNPVGVSIETFLSLTPIGKLIPTVLWGILTIWDGYLLSTNSPDASWVNFLISLAGCAYGKIAQTISKLFKGIKTSGLTLAQTIKVAMKEKTLNGYFSKLPTYFKNIQSVISSAMGVLKDKLGITWISNAVSFVMGKMKEISNVISKGSILAVATKKSVLAGASDIAQNAATDAVMGNNDELDYTDVLKANKGRKLTYDKIDL